MNYLQQNSEPRTPLPKSFEDLLRATSSSLASPPKHVSCLGFKRQQNSVERLSAIKGSSHREENDVSPPKTMSALTTKWGHSAQRSRGLLPLCECCRARSPSNLRCPSVPALCVCSLARSLIRCIIALSCEKLDPARSPTEPSPASTSFVLDITIETTFIILLHLEQNFEQSKPSTRTRNSR